MMGGAIKWRSRAPCLLPPFVAVLLLFAPTAQAFLSTIHLGRTLKSLRARDQERQLLLQQEQERQQQVELETLPPGLPVSPSYELAGAEDPEPELEGAENPEHEADGTAVGETHPSWEGSPDEGGGGGDGGKDEPAVTEGQAVPADVSRGWWHKKDKVDVDAGGNEDDAAAAAAAGHDVAVDGVDVAREQDLLLEEQGAGSGDRPKLSTARATAAAAAVITTVDFEGISPASHDPDTNVTQQQQQQQELPEEEGDMKAENSVLGNTAESVEIREDSSGSGGSVDHAGAALEVLTDFSEEGAEATLEKLDPTTSAAAAGVAEQEEQTEEQDGQSEPEMDIDKEIEEMLGREEEEEPEAVGDEDLEEQEEVVYDDDVEAAAIQQILGLRAAKDRAVQDAAARAVEALPATQRECFEDVKAFAFGGEAEGGLSEADVAALETVAICGDRAGVVLAFLRHSKFDVRKAKESIQRCCAWRKENKADDIFGRAVSAAKMRKHREYWPTGFHKKDRLGRPVFYDRVGQSDLSKLRAGPDGLDQDEMVQIFTQNMEARRRFVLTRLSREAGHPVDQMTTVLDLTGLGMRHMSKEAISYTRRISEVFQDNYSGMTCSLLILNAPWVFNKGWQIIESFLSEDTVAKVKVLGKGEAGLKELEKHISKENIPEFLGGDSPAVIGPSDPLWTEVDGGVRAWAEGSDPFLNPKEIKRVSRRIAREREAALSSSASKSEPKSEQKSAEETRMSMSRSERKSVAVSEEEIGAQGSDGSGALREEAVDRVARKHEGSDKGDVDHDEPVAVGGDDDSAAAAAAAERKKVPAKASRRAAAAVATASAIGEGPAPRRSAVGSPKRSSKRRRRDADNQTAAEEAEETGHAQKEKKPRRKRSGLVSASRRSTGRPSSSSRRPSSASVRDAVKDGSGLARARAKSPTMEGVDTAEARTASGRPSSPVPGGTAASRAKLPSMASSSFSSAGRKRRERKHKRGLPPGEEESATAGGAGEESDADDEEKGAVEESGGDRAVAAWYVERFAEVLGPALGPFFKQMVDGLLAAAKVLLSTVESALRFLRDLFFEQIEVDE